MYTEAIARLAAKKSQLARRDDTAPTRTYTAFEPPRPLSDWVIDGQIVDGFEASGKAFPYRVMDAPAEFSVVGEARFTDGRFFLDFGMRPAWIEANSDYRWFPESRFPLYLCPDCGGKDHEHHKISIPNESGIGFTNVKCPRDPRKSWGR